MGEALVCVGGGTLDKGALWMGEIRLVDARGMPMCMKRKGGQCDEVPSLQMSVCVL